MNVQEFEKCINRYMKIRTPLDVKAVYETLKDRFPLTLTNAFALENGEKDYDADFTMVCGTSSAGSFQLYDNGLYCAFDVDKADGSYSHWHPENIAEAVEDVIAFMQGICKNESCLDSRTIFESVVCFSRKTTHEMKLHPAPFEKIKRGEKTIELRLLDEKRRLIKEGDTITFTNTADGEKLSATVRKLHCFDSFEELYKTLPLLQCGYTPEDVGNAHPSDMEQYYSAEEQKKYGVVGIELFLQK